MVQNKKYINKNYLALLIKTSTTIITKRLIIIIIIIIKIVTEVLGKIIMKDMTNCDHIALTDTITTELKSKIDTVKVIKFQYQHPQTYQ